VYYLTNIEALSQPQENGIVILMSGFLLALGLYHFLLYFQHKDKTYLYYSLYAFLVFFYTYHRAKHFVLADISKPLVPYFEFLYDPTKWVYSTVYLLFAISFVDLDKYSHKLYTYLTKFIRFSFVSVAVLTSLSVVLNDKSITDFAYNFVYLPIIFLLSIYILYIIWKTKSEVKYYLLVGAGVYLVVTTFSHFLTYTGRPFRILFYAATAFEMILFALGLGKKQKLILEEKNRWQEKVIQDHIEKLELKELLNQQLDKEITKKSKQILLLNKDKEADAKQKDELVYSKQILQLRMQAVQAQMNPHFLFNSLTAIKNYIIKNNKKDAVLYLSRFAKLLRMILENAKQQEISLRKEFELLNLYVEIENIRFDKSIDFELDIDKKLDISSIKVPPLIFQAFIENAIWHGLSPKKGEKKLLFKATAENDYVKIEIEDNGIGRAKALEISNRKAMSIPRESLGIKLTIERLEIYTQALQADYKIDFIDLYDDNENPTGTRVLVYIPK
jgi:sensor histidine kinase YesM